MRAQKAVTASCTETVLTAVAASLRQRKPAGQPKRLGAKADTLGEI
jgi:hypothetical protein